MSENDKHLKIIQSTVQRAELEALEEWRELAFKMPRLQFKSDWQVQIMPPFGFVTCRFRVYKGDKDISVYFDYWSRTGAFGEDPFITPFWEIYPVLQEDGSQDNVRFAMHDTEGLLAAIDQELNR